MKTFILLVPNVGGTIETDDVVKLAHFIGMMNVDTDATDSDTPGIVMFGTLTDAQKEMVKSKMLYGDDNTKVAVFFIEYEDSDENNFNSTLLHKPKNNERE